MWRPKRSPGQFLLEALLVLAVFLVVGLLWWPLSKAQDLAGAERRAIVRMQELGKHLTGSSDLRGLVQASALSGEGSFDFQTENLASCEGYLFRYSKSNEQILLYAWPLIYAQTGNAAFCFETSKSLLESRNHRRQYSGVHRQPPEKAALPAGTDDYSAQFGKDAQEWRPVAEKPR